MKRTPFVILIFILIVMCVFGCTPKTHINETSKSRQTINSTMKNEERISTIIQEYEEGTKQYFVSSNYKYSFMDGGIKLEGYQNSEEKEEILLPSGIDGKKVVCIGAETFFGRKEVKKFKIPLSITQIEGSAFYRCHSLEKAYIHKNIQTIDGNPYFRCSSLKEIDVDSENQKYCDVDGVLFNKDKTILIAYPEGRKQEVYKIPDGVKQIDSEAFGYWPETLKVYIPKSVIKFSDGRLTAHGLDDLTLIVEKDSAAMKYAIENSLPYEINT